MELLLDNDSVNFASTLRYKDEIYTIFTAISDEGHWIWFVLNSKTNRIADISLVPLPSELEAQVHFTNYFELQRYLIWTPLNLKNVAKILELKPEQLMDTGDMEDTENLSEEITEELPMPQKPLTTWQKFLAWLKNLAGKE